MVMDIYYLLWIEKEGMKIKKSFGFLSNFQNKFNGGCDRSTGDAYSS
jgi:hypothetical protein